VAQGLLVHGQTFYAPLALRTDDGRLVMWGWLKEGRPPAALLEAGWAGVMSLPMALSLTPEGAVRIAPVEELKALRRQHWHFEELEVAPEAAGLLGDIRMARNRPASSITASPSAWWWSRMKLARAPGATKLCPVRR
jgi:hypothetical protein